MDKKVRATLSALMTVVIGGGLPLPIFASGLQYVFHPLIDPLYPGNSTEGVDINNRGQVLADSRPNGWFTWEDGNVTYSDGTSSNVPLRINDLGDITGYHAEASSAAGWLLSNGVEQTLEELPGGQMWNRPHALNNLGEIFGYSLAEGNARHLVRWDYDGSVYDLGEPVEGYGTYQPNDINDAGIVVGYMTSKVSRRGSAWKMENDLVTILPDHDSLASDSTLAFGINAKSEIVGTYKAGTSTFAALWTSNGVKILDSFPGGAFTVAFDINDSEIVVGWAKERGSSVGHATLWQPDGAIHKLSDLTSGAEGWELTIAHAINNRGDIVGQAKDPSGMSRGFVLVRIPEPSTFSLTLISICLAMSHRPWSVSNTSSCAV